MPNIWCQFGIEEIQRPNIWCQDQKKMTYFWRIKSCDKKDTTMKLATKCNITSYKMQHNQLLCLQRAKIHLMLHYHEISYKIPQNWSHRLEPKMYQNQSEPWYNNILIDSRMVTKIILSWSIKYHKTRQKNNSYLFQLN